MSTTKRILNKKRVLLIHTGGTFGMEKGRPFLSRAKSKEYLGTLTSRMPELSEMANLSLAIHSNLDSSDVKPEEWKSLAELIVSEWDSFDGFVIIHGTDTMAFTASALAFFFQGLTKPVVLTGSQLPISELRTDARANIMDSIELATLGYPEVMICFDSRVHRGTRASKYSNEHLQAFRSLNSQPLGSFGVHFTHNKKALKPPRSDFNRPAPRCDARISSNVIILDCVPGASLPVELINSVVDKCEGVVLRGFGSGNLPLIENSWLKLCEKALQKKTPVVMATQCVSGRILLDAYENSRAYRDAGVISSEDMSFEALTVKLMVMLGRKIPFDKRHKFFSTPIANECRQIQIDGGETE